MRLKVLQLNMNADSFWDNLIKFLNTHDFDIIQLQEVAGENTFVGNIHSTRNCFALLTEILKKTHNSELVIAETFTSSPSSFLGNATFYKKDFSILSKESFHLYQRSTPFPSEGKKFEEQGRAALFFTLKISNTILSLCNVHFPWAQTPQEQPHQIAQGEKLLQKLRTLSHPFIITGDFNLTPNQPTIQEINMLAKNLTIEFNITNTLNPREHRAKDIFPQGFAVDYIFVSNDIKPNHVEVLQYEDISDHFVLTAELEI